MEVQMTDRGFEYILFPLRTDRGKMERLVGQSSITDGEHVPGGTCLWFGEEHHLERDEVKELKDRLEAWLDTGSLALPNEVNAGGPPALHS